MKLLRIDQTPPQVIAEIEPAAPGHPSKVVNLHPSVGGPIERTGYVALPALQVYAKQFHTNNFKIKPTHPQFPEALVIALDAEYATKHPDLYKWVGRDP